MANLGSHRSLNYTCSLCYWAGFVLFLASIPLFVVAVAAVFAGSPALLSAAIGTAISGLLLMLLADALPFLMAMTESLRGIGKSLAAIAEKTGNPGD